MKIYLVRHAETELNKEHIMQGRSENPQINIKGTMQATELKNKIKDINFTVCFTSPLIRCWSTAMILVGDRVEIKEDKRLIERDLGLLEGKDRSCYDVEKYWDYNLNSNDDNVEKIQDIFKRCNEFLQFLKENYDEDDNILVVSHSAITRCLHHILESSDLNKNLLGFKIDNCYFKEYNLK